jgi:hypothetical protein
VPHPCYIDREALRVVGASAIGTLQLDSSAPMAPPKRAKSATSSTRKRKAVGEDPEPTPGTDPHELKAVERDPDYPLSFLPAEHRSGAAQQRVLDQLIKLLNVVNEGSNYVSVDARPTFLTMFNITSAMIAVMHRPAVDSSDQAIANEALHDLERKALELIKKRAPDQVPLLPSTHFDLERKYNLTSSKLALLDVVADALEGRVKPGEQETDGKLDTRVLDNALATEMPDDDVGKRADAITKHILGELITDEKFAKLLMRPAFAMSILEDRRRLAPVIRRLMKLGNATVVQVARAVLYVFGVDAKRLKNTFSPKLLDEWAATRASRAVAS